MCNVPSSAALGMLFLRFLLPGLLANMLVQGVRHHSSYRRAPLSPTSTVQFPYAFRMLLSCIISVFSALEMATAFTCTVSFMFSADIRSNTLYFLITYQYLFPVNFVPLSYSCFWYILKQNGMQ